MHGAILQERAEIYIQQPTVIITLLIFEVPGDYRFPGHTKDRCFKVLRGSAMINNDKHVPGPTYVMKMDEEMHITTTGVVVIEMYEDIEPVVAEAVVVQGEE